MLLPIAVPATLPKAEAAATCVVLSACATVTIEVARTALHNQSFNIIFDSVSLVSGHYIFCYGKCNKTLLFKYGEPSFDYCSLLSGLYVFY